MNSPVSKWIRLRRLPTWRIWLPLLLIPGGLFCWLGPNVYGWLALTERISGARYVAVEGWAPDYVLAAAKHEFGDANAVLLLTTGLPLERGMFLSEYKDFATLAAALKTTLNGLQVPALDKKLLLVTLGTHARRSHIIYQRVLGPEWQVGVVAVPQRDFPKDTWYKQSSGVKGVINELVALVVMTLGDE